MAPSYHKILEPPITVLMDATAHIQDRDLNFQITFDGQDELGQLCTAFEKMRQTLYENNRQLWSMLEERRALQASVAHDLRNSIAKYVYKNVKRSLNFVESTAVNKTSRKRLNPLQL